MRRIVAWRLRDGESPVNFIFWEMWSFIWVAWNCSHSCWVRMVCSPWFNGEYPFRHRPQARMCQFVDRMTENRAEIDVCTRICSAFGYHRVGVSCPSRCKEVAKHLNRSEFLRLTNLFDNLPWIGIRVEWVHVKFAVEKTNECKDASHCRPSCSPWE